MLGGLIYSLESFLQLNMCQDLQIFAFLYMYYYYYYYYLLLQFIYNYIPEILSVGHIVLKPFCSYNSRLHVMVHPVTNILCFHIIHPTS